MSNYSKPRHINVEFTVSEKDLSKVGIIVESDDGKDLSAQDILDAISDVLLMEWDHITNTPLLDSDLDS